MGLPTLSRRNGLADQGSSQRIRSAKMAINLNRCGIGMDRLETPELRHAEGAKALVNQSPREGVARPASEGGVGLGEGSFGGCEIARHPQGMAKLGITGRSKVGMAFLSVKILSAQTVGDLSRQTCPMEHF